MNIDEHKLPTGGQHYSARNKIPNIHEFVAQLDKEKRERDAAIEAEDKEHLKIERQAQHPPNGNSSQAHVPEKKDRKKTKTVRDPVTGKDVEIEDPKDDFEEVVENPQITVPNQNLGKDATIATSSDQSGEEYRYAQDVTAPPAPVEPGSTTDVPIHSEKTNVNFFKTPSVSYEPMFEHLERRANVLCAGIFFSVIIVGKFFGGALYGLIPLGFCVASGVFLWVKDLITQGRNMEWSSEKDRGETATVNLVPESVEWMNTALGIMWNLINPEMFAGLADTLEDVMVASVPGIIENVRVADISQGSNPLRILSLRALPDHHVQDIKDEAHKQNQQNTDPNELAAMEQAGSFYNLEASVAYHAKPSGADVSSKARNMGMQLIFYLGIRGLFGVPLPIWVELQGLVATARIRLQLTPEPPFLKTLTFTLMGIPKVQAGCTPMIEKGVNILNLPLISNFVNWAIGTAASMYVAPKSMTLDLSKMLQGDDIKKETLALGLLFIRVHKAVGLSKQDRRGSEGGGSDPYITIAWSKFSKPQFCTRVIQDDLNPIFEESCGLLVTADLIKADEQLSVELWDSDRSSADDIVGKVELSIQKLIQHPGKMFPQVSKLAGVKADTTMPGELHWEVGFFGKTQFRKALRTDGKDVNLPPELKDKKELQDEKGTIENEEEDAVEHTPPDPLWPSGILSIVVHQIVGLELANVKGSNGKRKGREYEPARLDAGEVKEEQGSKLPSSYCTILVNDELVYKTRTKAVSSQPIFNAGTEKFVRDWRSSVVTITVRDSRNRQHDPIIGVVPLKLSDILQTGSEATRWYPLDGGVGYGRIRISILFRSVDLRLPPTQLGWDVGTFEFTSREMTAVGYGHSKTKVRLRTGGSSASVKRDTCTKLEGQEGFSWDISGENKHDKIRLPVRYRYRSPVFFEFYPPGKRRAEAFASLWLQDFPDQEERDFDIPIWKCDKGLRLSQNYIIEKNFKDVPDIHIEELGRLKFRGRFSPGTDRDHIKFVTDNDSRETIETWEACFAEGVRGEEVKAEIPPAVQKLHDESLTHGRDVLAQADPKEKAKWLSKDGTDWSTAFGQDPTHMIDGEQEDLNSEGRDDFDEDYDDDNSSDLDLGITDASTKADSDETRQSIDSMASETPSNASKKSNGAIQALKDYKSRSRDLHRQHRGLMQWRPMRNVQFAKNEAKFAVRKITKLGSLNGRKPDVETEV
ncbi:C2 domain-containing protein [Colletotrichum graminicola]|uniref:C2 domain-containing protein n=1 Tax=Colletotrichum graminicola (strain M1.001 / M2 / FGSC 10212) TaxID=645133 RepID=E3QLC1_COLGM|nr:C2 domain-containing protein [Colletotrichum graminicola M1.001]EFQ31659.1 C2 domain-containing protein [Colletotrichum graminicola M1.001]WDK10074.1 C2 domain-containing protein [Colletotrichum graminicola]